MAAVPSNQELWKIITGYSSLRQASQVEAELCSKEIVDRFQQCLSYYKPPSSGAAKKLKDELKPDSSGSVIKQRYKYLCSLSEHIMLDQQQTHELLKMYLIMSYKGTKEDLEHSLSRESEWPSLTADLESYYFSERLRLLQCIKYLYSYWQDRSHPYQKAFCECFNLRPKQHRVSQLDLVKDVWKQYKAAAKEAAQPPPVAAARREVWVMQRLKEQCCLLEILLLHYKDFDNERKDLLEMARFMHDTGFHYQQQIRLGPGAQNYIKYINYLYALILVESVNLDYVVCYMEDESRLKLHPLLSRGDSSLAQRELKDLEKLKDWTSVDCHGPFLLALMLLRYSTCLTHEDFEEKYQPLGEAAMQCGVFDYLLAIVKSPHFTSSSPVASLGKALVHTLLSLAITCFSVGSLDNLGTLVSIATHTLTFHRLQLELWEKGLSSGIGVLVSEAMASFPQESPFSLLLTLSSHPLTAASLTNYLLHHKTLALQLSSDWSVIVDGETVILTQSTQLFVEESVVLSKPPLTLPAGSQGQLLSDNIVCWDSPVSALDTCAFLTVSLLHHPGVGVDTEPLLLVETVTDIIALVGTVLSSDWTLYKHYKPITAQCYKFIQRYSSLPQPPIKLIAACVKCLSVLASNEQPSVWEDLARTGFLPYISGPTSTKRVPVSPGHFGSILNTWERTRGLYDVTVATLDLLLGGVAHTDLLGPVVWACEEIMSSCGQWRYKTRSSRDELAHKLLVLSHKVLENSHCSRVKAYLTEFLVHSHGHRPLVAALSLGVGVVDKLLTNQQQTVQIDSLKLAFRIIDKLLANKSGEDCFLLEHTLATQSVTTPSGPTHLISVIASYIHHHGNPHVPLGATKLLTRLSLVSPMSVFACLGQLATPIRDAFIRRLQSQFEEVELKVAILELTSASVQCQPGMAELFLSIKPTPGGYSTGESSCLNPILDLLKSSRACPPALLVGAVTLLSCLWEGRHDAALIALRATPDFWKKLTSPLQDRHPPPTVVAKVMGIVAMETHYTVRGRMDQQLKEVIAKLAKDGMGCWFENDTSHESTRPKKPSPEVVQSISSLLLVLTSAPDTKDFFKPLNLRLGLLASIFQALKSHLTDSTLDTATVTELSTLYTILLRKWSDAKLCELGNQLLALMTGVLPNIPSELTRPLYSAVLLTLQTAKKYNKILEPRHCIGIIPCIASSLQASHTLQEEKKISVVCIYSLNEIIRSYSPDLWLRPMQQAVLGQILVRQLDNLLTQLSEADVVEAMLVLCLGIANSKEGAESLLMNGIASTLCISLTGLVSLPDPPTEWRKAWLLALKLSTTLLHSIGNQFVSHALDFVCAHWDKLSTSLDLGHAVKELALLDESQATCRLLLGLALYHSNWKYTLPAVALGLLQHLVSMVTSTAVVLSKRAVLKHIVRAMYSGGYLTPEQAPVAPPTRSRSVGRTVSVDQAQLDDSLVTSCPAFSLLQEGLLSILSSCLSALRHFSPPLEAMIVDGVLDLVEYPPLFTPSLAAPTLDNGTAPSLGALTTCLTTLLSLLNKTDPGSLSVERSPRKRESLLYTMEQGLFLLLSQVTRYLVDPQTPSTDKQLLKKELSSELSSFLQSLLLSLSRTSVSSPSHTPSRSRTSDSISRQTSQAFDGHPLFRFADTYNKHFL